MQSAWGGGVVNPLKIFEEQYLYQTLHPCCGLRRNVKEKSGVKETVLESYMKTEFN